MPLAVSLVAVFGVAALISGLLAKLTLQSTGMRAQTTGFRASWLMGPVLAGVATCSALIFPGVLGACHCVGHGLHHPHLCLRHPDFAVAILFPALGVAAAWLCVATPGLARLCTSAWQTSRWAYRLSKQPTQALGNVSFRLVDAPGLGACTTGLLRPLIAVDRGLWSALNEEERQAVLHHEDAHRQRLDPLTLFVLKACASLAAMPGADAVLRHWQAKVEEECDRHAAEVIGSPECVASALLAIERYRRTQPLGPLLLQASAGGGSLEMRVRTLLADSPSRRANLASDCLSVSLAGIALAIFLALVSGDLVHHGAETLLGLFVHHP
jgi:Zn-dependent protease with chaperone function